MEEMRVWREKINNVLIPEIHKIIIGQEEAIHHLVICLLSGSEVFKTHTLFESVPGTGKTRLAKTVAKVIGGKFSRIQGTPDLLPTDIVGLQTYNPKTQEFKPELGPIFANIVLVDEISRMPPKTQSALLEAMEEGTVTIGKTTFPIQDPFIVLATQNPIEYEGVFPLAEAQIDRFMMKVKLDYPSKEEEVVITRQVNNTELSVEEVFDAESILLLRDFIRKNIYIDDRVRKYIVVLVQATRPEQTGIERIKKIVVPDGGASPRASIALEAASKVRAFLAGLDCVRPDDVEAVAPAILRHRIRISPEERIDGDPHEFIEELIRGIIKEMGKINAAEK